MQATTVIRSKDSVTGYFVTFRYKAPEDIKRVRFNGEMLFSDKANTTQFQFMSNGIIDEGVSLLARPEEWKPHYFPCTNGNQGAWLLDDMEYNAEHDIWSYTIPLPSGSYAYRFIVGGSPDAELNDRTDTYYAWDPNNAPYVADKPEDERRAAEYQTGIEVPFDPTKQIRSNAIETELTDEKGTVDFFTYTGSGFDGLYAGIYLPYGYSESAEPYKLLILCGGGVEGAWFNEGAAANILDNLFAMGYEKFIVVTPNLTQYFFPAAMNDEQFTQAMFYDLKEYLFANYNVSRDINDHAVGGISSNGASCRNALFSASEQVVGYAIFFSTALDEEVTLTPERLEIIKDIKVLHAYGAFETMPGWSEILLDDNGIYLDTFCSTVGGHQWTTWKDSLVYAIENFLWK